MWDVHQDCIKLVKRFTIHLDYYRMLLLHYSLDCDWLFSGVTGTHTFHIYPPEIQQCLTKFEGETNLIFFLTTQSCALRTRKDLGMVLNADPTKPLPEHYYDPLGTGGFVTHLF